MAQAPTITVNVAGATAAIAAVLKLHSTANIYDECDCPDGTHPEEYAYVDCGDYNGCEHSLTGIGCNECCVDTWDSLTEDCGETHSHSKDPEKRCATLKVIHAAMTEAGQ